MADIDTVEKDLQISSKILEWEFGDMWGHVGARIPGEDAVALKLFRPAVDAPDEPWLVRFDFEMNKISGISTPPFEAAIYTEIFKARPDVGAAIHSHAPMCVAMSLADNTIDGGHMQTGGFGMGVPTYPKQIYIVDAQEGADLARAMGDANGILIRGHGIVVVGKNIQEATLNAVHLERAAKVQTFARLMGYRGTTEENLEEAHASLQKLQARAKELGSQQQTAVYPPEWIYFEEKLKSGEMWNRGWT